jgi:hypothetical protein
MSETATVTAPTDELTKLRAELAALKGETAKKQLQDEIAATQRELSGQPPHPSERTDPKVKATFDKAAVVAKSLNEKGYMGSDTWHPHGHIDPVTKQEVCELHTHGSDQKLSKWENLG